MTSKTNKQIKFFRNRGVIDRIIRSHLIRQGTPIVHGSKAQNIQLPGFLRRRAKDWDVFVKNPKKSAGELERALDRKFRGDFFGVKKGKLPGVRKVFSKINEENFADFSVPDRKVPTKRISGIQFAKLIDQKRRAIQNLRDPEKEFRRQKDKDFLVKVRLFEKLRRKQVNG